ncbi:MAG: methyltransferase domain-containing protein [Deltaproteobacteria bacterium]|jgi:16S rRNA (cytosine967-C5)-methyltransferase|nr:methyltransferase domain-containing protein [Deltaproteobacteria bacterium]
MLKYFSDPRRVAYEVNLLVLKEKARPEELLKSAAKLLSPMDRRLAQSLVYDSLRHRLRLERLIKNLVPNKKPPKKSLEVLKIGLCQLLFMDRLPAHAAVNETVKLAKAVSPHQAGLVNAILVSLAKEREAKKADPQKLFPIETCPKNLTEAEKLSIFYGYPLWLVNKLLLDLGFRETRAFLVASNARPGPTIRVNPLKYKREFFLKNFLPQAQPTQFSPYGLVNHFNSGPIEDWPGYADGLFSIQDEASQLLPLLAGQPKTILDTCAGLGGKSLALATVFPKAQIFSVDTSKKRLAYLRPESQRLGLRKLPTIIQSDALSLSPQSLKPGLFDLVVVDAPCSNLGVIRRRPDIKWKIQPEDPAQRAQLQFELLLTASGLVAPGGRLIYCVCTFTNEEGPEVIQKFLAQRPNFTPLAQENFAPNLSELFIAPGQLRLWPQKHHTDAFFYAVLTMTP